MTQKILLVLLGALSLVVAWRYGIEEPDEPAVARSPAVAVREPQPEIQLARLDLASLDAARPSMAAGRDPWRFQDPPPRKLAAESKPIPTAPSQQPSASPQPAMALPALTLEYLGSFGPREKRIAVLSDGKRTFNALTGDVIDGRFIVERIGYESVEIRRVGLPSGSAERLGLRRR